MSKVFVADRDAGSRKGLAHALRQRDIDVEEFESGPALYARALTEDPDLIVLDTDLEEMDGFQVFARLQRKRPEKPFPVLFVTDFDHPRVARICRERGAVGYVGKSRPLEQILDAVLEVMERPEPLAGRPLPAALAWLQSRGKTGRLDVEANDRSGYVLLHKGRVLDAEWGSWRGEDVLKAFAERIPVARYRFAEGIDDLERPAGAAPPVVGVPPTRATPSPAAPADEARLSERLASIVTEPATAPDSTAMGPRRLRPPLRAPAPAAPAAKPAGSLAALQELQAGRTRQLSGRKRRALAAAAAAALIVTTSLGLATLYSGPLPASLGQMLTLIRGGEGGTVASVSRPQPRVTETVPGASPASEVPPRVEPAEAVVATGRPEEDTAGRFDVTPSAAARHGASFGPDAELRATEPAAASVAAKRGESRPAPVAKRGESRPGPVAKREESRPAPVAPERRRAAEDAPRDVAAGGDARDCREGWTDAFCLGTAADAGGREVQAAEPRTQAPRAPAPDEEPSPVPQQGAVSPAAPPAAAPRAAEVVPEAGRDVAGAAGAPAAESRAPAGVAGQGETRQALAARAGKPVLEKPVLLKRGQGLYYPPELKAQGVGGNVLLNIRVGDNGRAQQVEVAKSSGYDAFDQAAVAAVGTFLWEPARDADGATEAWITQAVTFRP